jgi:hypothetical protein
MDILKHASLSAYETASMMTWDIKANSWEAFPIAQQWFATGEALSHLQYLKKEGLIRRIIVDGIVQFSRKDDEYSITEL